MRPFLVLMQCGECAFVFPLQSAIGGDCLAFLNWREFGTFGLLSRLRMKPGLFPNAPSSHLAYTSSVVSWHT